MNCIEIIYLYDCKGVNMDIENLKFDKDGLIPAVVVDCYSRKVLTVAYMNKESLAISIKAVSYTHLRRIESRHFCCFSSN